MVTLLWTLEFVLPFIAVLVLGRTAQAKTSDPKVAQAVYAETEMVVSANPLATKAGEEVLARGGTAVDAMVAVQTVLGLVEPQSSGMGGGAFVVYFDAQAGQLTTIDAREKAPAAATGDRFSAFSSWRQPWQTGLSVGVPGVPRMMEYMHSKHGNQDWSSLFANAKMLAKEGFNVFGATAYIANLLLSANTNVGYNCSNRLFFRDPTAFAYFTNSDETNCQAKPAGTPIKNEEYAKLMELLSESGSDAFYMGEVAEAIVASVKGDLSIPGDMEMDDLAAYEVIEREAVCIEYKSFKVCGMGPPSSGALAVGQQLGILEALSDFAADGDPLDEKVVHHVALAGRLAFADRALYVGDSDFVTVPAEGMLDKSYLASRAALVGEYDFGTAQPGKIDGFDPAGASDARSKSTGTSHISIVDRYGNVLSMTTSIEAQFGNGVMVPDYGFLLNNQLTDFSLDPGTPEAPISNRVQPGKRPRSSMSPTIVFDKDGKPYLVAGSPGGSRIIGYTLNAILGVLEFGLDPQEAINLPHYLNRNGPTELEEPKPGITISYDYEGLVKALEARNHTLARAGPLDAPSGLALIQIKDGVLIGGADRRRDVTVGGQ